MPDYQNFQIKSCPINGILLCKYHTLVTHKELLKGYVIQYACQLSSWNVPVKTGLNNRTLIIPWCVLPPCNTLLNPSSVMLFMSLNVNSDICGPSKHSSVLQTVRICTIFMPKSPVQWFVKTNTVVIQGLSTNPNSDIYQ
jgi:hypothetical protein